MNYKNSKNEFGIRFLSLKTIILSTSSGGVFFEYPNQVFDDTLFPILSNTSIGIHNLLSSQLKGV